MLLTIRNPNSTSIRMRTFHRDADGKPCERISAEALREIERLVRAKARATLNDPKASPEAKRRAKARADVRIDAFCPCAHVVIGPGRNTYSAKRDVVGAYAARSAKHAEAIIALAKPEAKPEAKPQRNAPSTNRSVQIRAETLLASLGSLSPETREALLALINSQRR